MTHPIYIRISKVLLEGRLTFRRLQGITGASIALLILLGINRLHAQTTNRVLSSSALDLSSTDTASDHWFSIYVSPMGRNTNSGSSVRPLKSLQYAIRYAREMRRLNKNRDAKGAVLGVQIVLKDGVYAPEETLQIRPEDGGTATRPNRMVALHPGNAVISGGLQVTGWQKIQPADPLYKKMPKGAVGKIYVADLPREYGSEINARQLWVNGKKAVRAVDKNASSDGRRMQRILSWDHEAQSCWILRPPDFDTTQAAGIEMLIQQWWAVANLRIKSVKAVGDSLQLHFYAPESRLQSEHPWPAPWISEKTGNSAFYLTNAACFLDEPAEWYLDQKTQKLYYIPRNGEDLSCASVILPYLTTILKIAGTAMQSVKYFQVQGIDFEYSTWLRPSMEGHVPLQAGMYLLEAYKLKIPGTPAKATLENQAWIGRPPGGVELYFTHQVGIKGCRFRHMASTGLDLVIGTKASLVEGNLFKDIGGTGIQIGTYAPENFETHLAYNPKNKGLICRYDTVRNNLVTDVTNEDWGCVGISAGYVQHLLISHNEVSDVSYSGICVGWGWTKKISALAGNEIRSNKVTHYGKRLYDVGGLYTLSAQPGTVIQGNYIDSIYKAPYPHDPEHWFYFYLDEGSSYITIKDNWCPALKVMKNANGPGNSWQDNGPEVADSIKNRAGLQPAYQYLLANKITDPSWPVQPVPVVKKNNIEGNKDE